MMTKWMTVKEVKGESGVYEFGKGFFCGDDMIFAMEAGEFPIRTKPADGKCFSLVIRMIYRVNVPSMKLSALATYEGVMK